MHRATQRQIVLRPYPPIIKLRPSSRWEDYNGSRLSGFRPSEENDECLLFVYRVLEACISAELCDMN